MVHYVTLGLCSPLLFWSHTYIDGWIVSLGGCWTFGFECLFDALACLKPGRSGCASPLDPC